MEDQWIWIAGTVLFGLIVLVGALRTLLARIAPRTEGTFDDKLLEWLTRADPILRTIAAALGIEVKATDSNKEVAAKVKAKLDSEGAKKG